jgi:hypothetical protein
MSDAVPQKTSLGVARVVMAKVRQEEEEEEEEEEELLRVLAWLVVMRGRVTVDQSEKNFLSAGERKN